MEDTVMQTVIALSIAFLPFLGMVAIVTEFVTGFTGWEGNAAKATSSVSGIILGGAIVLAFWLPVTAPYVGSAFFLLLCITGPSGGHDLIKKFTTGATKKD